MSCHDLDDDACRKIAEPMMDDTMDGFARHDYQRHTRHFSVALKSGIDPDAFVAECQAQRSAWGAPGTRELVCIFRKEKSFTLVWNQSFERADGQIMAVLTIALKGGRYFVDYFLIH